MDAALVFILMVTVVGAPFVALAAICGVLEEKERIR